MNYRREIDGLRAIAVLPVMLFHAGFTVFKGGFVGVDVFFVISGYLITTLILSEMVRGTFSLATFYERRARRILPALFLVVLCCLPPAWLWLFPRELKDFSQSLVAVSTFLSNILFWRESGYFATAAELKPLLHTWSLAIEEQYYVFFPLLLLAVHRLRRRWMFGVMILIGALSLFAAQWGAHRAPSATFYLLPTRAWELVLGALIALYFTYHPHHVEVTSSWKKTSEVLGLAGVLLIVCSVFLVDKSMPYPGFLTLLPTLGAGLVLAFSGPGTMAGRFLGLKPLVGIGLISYSAYLWHQPLLAFARHRCLNTPSAAQLFILLAVSIVMAYLSWRFVEQPLRDRRRVSRKVVAYGSVLGSALFLLIGFAGHVSGGAKFRYNLPETVKKGEFEFPTIDNGWCFYNFDTNRRLEVGDGGLRCFLGKKTSEKRGILMGDSFAGQYEPFWDIIGKRLGLNILAITTNWCYPSFTDGFPVSSSEKSFLQCSINRKYVAEHIAEYDFIVLGGFWTTIAEQGRMDEVYDLISRIAVRENKRVIIMASPAYVNYNSIMRYIYYRDAAPTISASDVAAVEANRLLEVYSRQFGNVLFVDRTSLFSTTTSGDSVVTDDAFPFSLDGKHLSIYGSRKSAEVFLESAGYRALTEFLQ